MTDYQRIVLAQRPHGEPTDDDLVVQTDTLPEPGPGEVALETLYLSLDPYMRGRMSDAKSYAKPVGVGETMVGQTVSRVIACPGGEFETGDVVLGNGGWATASVEDAGTLRRLDPDAAPLSTALGVLGMPGFTAYAGLREIGRPTPGETVVVAAATGPVGSAVGQIAKAWGARAVGIAGGPEKCAKVRELGFDAAVDHRADDFRNLLRAATPDGVDVYFENVGGKVFQAVLPLMNTFGRIPVCGVVSGYNATSLPEGPDRTGVVLNTILRSSLTVRGFIQTEFVDAVMDDFVRDMTGWVEDGTVQYLEDASDGFDTTRDAFRAMLTGGNLGKTLVKVAD